MDTQIEPKQDFYTYANGAWKIRNPIPPEHASWSLFSILNEKNQIKIHEILKEAAESKQSKPGSIEQKIGDFYASGMDETTINQQGITKLQPEFARIHAIHDSASLQAEIAHLHLMGINAIFAFGSMVDFKHSTQTIAATIQGGLSLPDRDYYLSDDKKLAHIRDEFLKHITQMFILLEETSEQALLKAQTVLRIETALAKASLSQTEMRDPNAVYHMMNIKALEELSPHFSWANYFQKMGKPKLKQLNVGMPKFVQSMDKLLQNTSIDDWKTYLSWHLLSELSPFLSKPFVDQNFHMACVLTGIEKHNPRWKRVVAAENKLLGFAIGEAYVKKYVSPASKQAVTEIMHNIHMALERDLTTLNWMTPSTRQAALKKLSMMEERIGYPNKGWDYSTLAIDRKSYVLNVLKTNQFLVQRDLNKIDKPVDRNEWEMPPQTINAYYDPSMNSINIPSGILQPPFFDLNAPAAVNYGAIGYIIGHEITHGFDDQGAKFDGNGNLNNWWTTEDLDKFQRATQCISNQFSAYKVADNLHVRGPLVVGEATADLGGLTLAYRAFHDSRAYKHAANIGGFTPDQQFFLSAAHIWAYNIRKEQELASILSDPHPPAKFRVNGTLANMPQFQAAFNITPPAPMINPTRCIIW